MLIGLTGPAGAGKDTAADYIVSAHKFVAVAFAPAQCPSWDHTLTGLQTAGIDDDLVEGCGNTILEPGLRAVVGASDDGELDVIGEKRPQHVAALAPESGLGLEAERRVDAEHEEVA